MSFRRAAVLCVVLILSLPSPSGADPGAYHWAGDGERAIVIENNLGPEWQLALTQAVDLWNASAKVQLTIGPPGVACWDFDAAVEVCEAVPPTTATWIGLSSVFKNAEGHITRAFVEVNENKTWGKAKRRFVLCHELGHAVGLTHRAAKTYLPSCMVPQFKFALRPASPDAQDLADLASMYDHVDPPPPPPTT